MFVVALADDDGVQREHQGFEVVDAVDGIADESGIPVARQADVADFPLVFRLAEGRERAVVGGDFVQFGLVFEAVDLIEVDVVDAEAVERAVEFPFRALVAPLLGLTAEEDILAVLAELRPQFELRVAVGRGHVEVVDALREDVFDHLVRALLFEPVERDSAERRDGTLVAGVAECACLHTSNVTVDGQKRVSHRFDCRVRASGDDAAATR
ncbi:hypothetical protein D320_14131 [Haloferax sp. BAB-2207]|nr:hypothetical protein D320_14131 [Haloferax sp. BAB-2207]